MALPASFLDELRARTPMAALVARHVKLARSGRQWKACCPFHGEKTPSFYVWDDHFHCYGCGAHGDAITFVMRIQGASFPEAVTQLAGEAGLEVPKPTPEAAAAERRRLDLHGVLDAAASAFARRLRAAEGRAALEYLRGRGLSDAMIDGWRLGWSGEGRGGLVAELADQAVTPALLVEAGLMTEPEPGRHRDLFFGRVMFPIHDARGRVISFGGRVLGDGQPKYLNGPETAVFSKRQTLFGLDRARAAARSDQQIVVVEGYLDVIALHQAGFSGAVAPLGTALTEAQLEALWRLSPAPVLCFDGDAAGGRAAARAVTLALPLLTPERTLRVVVLPEGDDPDSLLRKPGGAGEFAALLGAARELPGAVYEQARQGARTPEQRAAWKERLEAAAKSIRHAGLAAEYRRTLLDYFFKERASDFERGKHRRERPRPLPRPVPSPARAEDQIGRIVVCLLLRHPALLRDEEETFGELPLAPDVRPLQQAMLDWLRHAENLDAAALINHLRASGTADLAEALTAALSTSLPQGAREGAMPAEALEAFWHFVGLLRRGRLEAELAQAQQSLAQRFDEAALRRVVALRRVQARLYGSDPAGSAAAGG